MHVVEYEFVFTWDFNPVWTHYVISELKNAVRLVNNINTFDTWRYVWDVFCRCVVKLHAIYLHNWIHQNLSSFTPSCWFIVEKYYLKNNFFFLVVMWQSIRSLSKLCPCMLIPPIKEVLFLSKFSTFACLKFLMSL